MGRTMQVQLQLDIDTARRQLSALNSDAQKAFKSQGQSSPAYQQAAQQAAQQRVMYRDALAQQSAFNKALQDEAKLRTQNMQSAQRAQITQQQAAQRAQQQAARNYSPAAQTLASALPGGSILGSGLSGGGMAALAGASVVAAGVAAVGAEFNKLGDRARELASTSSNAASQLGQLRTSMEKNKISGDIAAISPSVVGFQKFVADIGTNLDDFFSHLSKPEDRAKAIQEKLAGGLGQGNEDWRRLKEQGVDLQQDIGIARTALQVKWQRSERDFSLEQRKFAVDTQNQVFDLQKQASRQQFDQQIAVQKFQENFANKQSQKAYDLSRQFATQSFAISQGRAIQDYNINRGDKQADFSRSLSDKQADFSRSLSDKKIDYTRSRADQSFDFNLNKSRSVEDRNIQLQDMALSGASGLDYFRAARSFNLSQSRNAQDFQISQGREARDYGIGQSREIRDYGIGQGREIRDFSIGQGRDARNLGIAQGRANQDFQQQAKEALASRQLELEAQEYARKYEGLELQTQINRQTQDLAISFQRLNQSIAFQQEGFANQKSDMAYDKRLDYSNFALQTGRQNRNFKYAEADFAGAARANDRLGAAGLGLKDPEFLAALTANARATGQTDLFQQVNAAKTQSDNSTGAGIGDWFNKSISGAQQATDWGNIGKAIDDIQKILTANKTIHDKLGDNYQGQSSPTVQTGNKTYSFNSGMSDSDKQSIQSIVDQGDIDTHNKIMDFLRRTYGG